MGRNPNAPAGVVPLALGDVRPNVKLAAHFAEGVTLHVEHMTFLSEPWEVNGHFLARVREAGGRESNIYLADIGICPRRSGEWPKSYTTHAQ